MILRAVALSLLLLARAAPAASESGRSRALHRELAAIDRGAPGELGVYLEGLAGDLRVDYRSDRPWFLASTVKVPVAVALLQLAEEGRLSLEETLVLSRSDLVDGSGELLRAEPGTRHSLKKLLELMIARSDSTATDLLIRRIGAEELNRRIRERMVPRGFGRITTLLDVRYDAYSELHPRARELSNLDFIAFRRAGGPEQRLLSFAARLGVRRSELLAPSLEEAFERYYRRGLNSATLEGFGLLLKRLVRGELLSSAHTRLLLGGMERVVTGEDRIKAGLPIEARFAQKTGTQVRRLCNVGIVFFEGRAPLVVAACLEKFPDPAGAEKVLRKVGDALGRLSGEE